MTWPSWRVALRVARREAWRSRGRSALVVAMIGLPVLALTFAAVVFRTAQLPPEEEARRQIGAAELRVQKISTGPVDQVDRHTYSTGDHGSAPVEPDVARTELPRLIPGARAVPDDRAFGVRIRTAAGGIATGELRVLPLTDPLVEGLVRLRSGRLPSAPDEIAVSPEVRRRLAGDVLTLSAPELTLTVTGTVVDPTSITSHLVLAPSNTRLQVDTASTFGKESSWLVGLPAGSDDVAALRTLNRAGYFGTPRTWILDPPQSVHSTSVDPAAVGVTTVAVGLAALEIVLLAGAAFAVGARRRRRELAVMAATGADRADVGRMVLGGAVVLGGVAGLAGLVLGAALVPLLRGPLERVNGALLGPLDLRPLELAVIGLVGIGTALLAALLPARAAARAPVVESLTGRRGQVRAPRRLPVVGLAAIVAGALTAFYAAGTGGGGSGSRAADFNLLLVGAVVAELGFVACAPTLVTLLGRVAGRLPLALRLAARDAARNRSRSGPAVAAVVAAVAGSVAVSAYLASDVDRQRRSYDPRLPRGMVEIESYALVDGSPLTPADRARALAALPVEQVVSIADPSRCSGVGDPSVPCPYFEVEAAPGGTACPPGCSEPFRPPLGSGLVVAGPELLELLTGRSQPAARAAMARGQVVAVDPSHLTAGQVRVRREVYAPAATGGAGAADPVRTTFTFPAHLLDGVPAYTAWPAVVVPPALAQRYGLATTESRVWATTTRMPTEREVEQARAAGNAAGVPVYVERGFVADNALTLLALLAASAVVTLGATGIATGLAAADSRPDLATLAAVGAAPRVRRVLSMAQAATVAGLGAGLGVLAGLIPAVAVIAARPEFDLVLPWTSLAATVVGVPLLAALCVGAFSRGRLPLERRLA